MMNDSYQPDRSVGIESHEGTDGKSGISGNRSNQISVKCIAEQFASTEYDGVGDRGFNWNDPGCLREYLRHQLCTDRIVGTVFCE